MERSCIFEGNILVVSYHDVVSLQGEEENDRKYCVASNHEARKLLQIVRTLHLLYFVLVVIVVVVVVVVVFVVVSTRVFFL